jgi:hypothetical protein
MIYTTTVIQEKNELNGIEQITQIDVDFSDEGVNLRGSVKVVGEWQQYLKTFEQDMRNNHKSLFPLPEPEEFDEEMI